jgi:single-strand DNA-binding protein
MARGLNQVFLIGTLTARPDMRYTPGGLAILDLNLAGQDTFTDESGQEREVPWYHRVRLLGRQAEMWGDLLEKGQLIFVEGRLEYRQWEKDGEKKSEVQVRAEFIDPLEGRGRETLEDARGQPRLRRALNQVILMGNLTRDPDLRYTLRGRRWCAWAWRSTSAAVASRKRRGPTSWRFRPGASWRSGLRSLGRATGFWSSAVW